MPSAQVELCHAYARAISALDMATLRTICAPDMTLTFFPSSFGVPKIEGIDAFLGGIQHVFAGTSEREYVIEDSEVMESEGRVWFFANFTGKNRLGDSFYNQIITRTRIAKGEDGKLWFTEISEYIDPEAERLMMKGGEAPPPVSSATK